MAPLAGEIAASIRQRYDPDDHVPSERKQKRDESTERIASELDERCQAVLEKAKANGTYRGGEMVTRHVDPATIRPPGWVPISKVPEGASRQERKAAILSALARQPLARAKLREVLGITSNQIEGDLKSLEAEGKVYRGDSVPSPGSPPSMMYHLVEEEEEMPEHVTTGHTVGERDGEVVVDPPIAATTDKPTDKADEDGFSVDDQLPLRLTLQKPASTESKLILIEAVLAGSGPHRRADLGRLFKIPASDVSLLLGPAVRSGRFEQRPAVTGSNPRSKRSPVIALPGDERDGPTCEVIVDIERIVIECALDSCDERFTPANSGQVYHSRACAEIAKHDRKGTQPLDNEKVCALDGCDERFTPSSPAQKYHSRECASEALRQGARESARRARAAQTTQPEQEPPMPPALAEVPANTPDRGLRDRYIDMLEDMIARAHGDRRARFEDRYFRTIMGAVELAESQVEEDMLLDRLERRVLS